MFIGDHVICVWPVKGGISHNEVLPQGTECIVEDIVRVGSRDDLYIKIKSPKDAFGYDVKLPKRPVYSGRRFMLTGQSDLVGLIKDL